MSKEQSNYVEERLKYAIDQKFDSVKDIPNLTVETALKNHPDVVRKVVTDSLSGGKDYRGILVPETVITVLKLDSQAAGKFASVISENKQSTNEELLAALEKQSEILEREYWAREIAKQVAVKDKEMLEALLYDNVPLEKLRAKDVQNAIVDQINKELTSREKLGINNNPYSLDTIKSNLKQQYKTETTQENSATPAAPNLIEDQTKQMASTLAKAAIHANPQLWALKEQKITSNLKDSLTKLLSERPNLEKEATKYLQTALKDKEFTSRLHSTSTIKTKDLEAIAAVLEDARENPDNLTKRNIINGIIEQAGLGNKKDKIYKILGEDLLKRDIKDLESKEFQLEFKRALKGAAQKKFGIALFGNTVKTAKLEGMKNMLNNQSSHVFTNPRSRKNSQVHAIG